MFKKIKMDMDELFFAIERIVYASVFTEFVTGLCLVGSWQTGFWGLLFSHGFTIGFIGVCFIMAAGLTSILLGAGTGVIYLIARFIKKFIHVNDEKSSTYCDDYDDIKVEII